jgi:hypothetical protein
MVSDTGLYLCISCGWCPALDQRNLVWLCCGVLISAPPTTREHSVFFVAPTYDDIGISFGRRECREVILGRRPSPVRCRTPDDSGRCIAIRSLTLTCLNSYTSQAARPATRHCHPYTFRAGPEGINHVSCRVPDLSLPPPFRSPIVKIVAHWLKQLIVMD